MLRTPMFHMRNTKPKRQRDASPPRMERVATIILGGGKGTRLHPLTDTRCKPAISFGGKGRLVDIPISNSLNSNCNKIFVISQFLSSSLHQHIIHTYQQGSYSNGFIELLSAEQKPIPRGWFQGPADAVRENVEYFIETPADYFLILSGDQLYNMDYRNVMRVAKASDADLVVATIPVDENQASRLGLMQIDNHLEIQDFVEKPKTQEALARMRIPEEFRISQEISAPYLGSMGIYLFKREALFRLLEQDTRDDFGSHLIPTQVKNGKTFAYIHEGYWEDIGTIESFYRANLALTEPLPAFNWYDEENPIYTGHCNLPPPKLFDVAIKNSLICEGSIVEAKEITCSILGYRTVVAKNTVIRNAYIMGNDFYEAPIPTDRIPEDLSIGENCLIENTIVDKHVSIGNNVILQNRQKLHEYEDSHLAVSDGIIVVKRGAILPDNFHF